MKTITTPAEHLLRRLLQSQKLGNAYTVLLEKNDGYTSLLVQSMDGQNPLFFPLVEKVGCKTKN
ncbi:hypothetical protein [Flavisolibacter nicotianae]|uniref:hypothetical protein n=1 Tax=Flavisolibacter nicotianae TaxID=2364882 RepID=UPI0013C5387C|nr:hypothetical protein [Flavisolibacter nicotianae]